MFQKVFNDILSNLEYDNIPFAEKRMWFMRQIF